MKLSNILDLMCFNDKVDIRQCDGAKTIFEGNVDGVHNNLLDMEVNQIWSVNNKLIIFVK